MTTCLLVAAAVGPFATHAVAAVRAWRGTSDAVWTNANNWDDTSSAPGTGDTAKFVDAGGAVDIISLGAGVTVNTISFETASAAAYTIGSGGAGIQTLTLDNGGAITVNSAVIQQEIFHANIVLGTDGTASNFTITNNRVGALNASPYLQFSGTFAGSTGSGLKTLTFDANGTAATNSFSAPGNISNGTSGTVKLVKRGDGIMTLGLSSTTMSYTGGTYLDAGTLQIVGNANNLKAGTSLYIAGGTNLNSINQSAGNYSNIVQEWNGDFSFNDSAKLIGSSLQQMTFTGGTVNLGATGTDTVRTINALANTFTVGGVISNGTNTTTTGLTKTGAGTMVLGGINTYAGTTTVNAGTLTITGAPAGGGAYAALGSGRLTISGPTGSLINSSAVTIAGGNLQLTNTSTVEGSVNRLSNSTAITSNGGTLTYANTTGNTYAENVGNVTLNGGQLNTVLSTNMATGIQTLTFNGLTQNNRSTATFSAATTAPNATTNIIKVAGVTATPAGQIIGPWATTGTSAIVQTDYAVYDAAGNIVAANIAGSLDSTWTDSTKAYTSNFLGGSTPNALSAVTHNMAALRNLPASADVAIAIPTGGNLNTYGLLNAHASTWTINQVAGSTGALSTPTGGGSIYINTGNGTATGNGAITIGAPINDNGGAVSIVKTGTGFSVGVGQGVLKLSNVTSNFTGATVINGGAIVLNTSGALANGGLASSLGSASISADNLVLNGGFLQYGTATTAVSTNRLFSIGAMGGTIDSSASITATMSFVGTGAMGFTNQTGPRTLTLQGSNVGVAASTSGSNSSLSTIALLIGDNSGVTSLNKAGAGTWALTNSASTYTGPTTITAGILNVGTFAAANTASSLGQGSATTVATDLVLNGGTLQYSNNTAATTNRLFSLGASSGTIDSSAASSSNTLSFTGTDIIGFNNQNGARTLTLAGTNVGANSMGLRLGDLGGLTNLTKSSTGTWVLANAGNTYTGVTTINNGILSGSKLANGGVASSIGASTNAAANLLMSAENGSFTAGNLGSLLSIVQPATSISLATVAPTLKYTGTGDSTDRTIKFTISSNDRAAVIDASGTGALNFTNANFTTNSTTSFSGFNRRLVLVLTGGNSADYTLANTISGIITDNGTEPTSIVKTGLGTWVLAGNNSYGSVNQLDALFLGTIVNQGTLVLSGSPTGTGKTRVNAGGTLKLDYSTNNTSKLADATGILQLGGGILELSGGSHVELVTSTTLAVGASSVTQTGGSATLNMGVITRSAGSTLNLGTGGIVLTSSGTANTLLTATAGAYATVGDTDWAAKNAGNTAIVGFSTVGAYSATTASALGGVGNQSDVASGIDTTLAAGDSTSTLRFNQNEARTITIGGGQILTLTNGGILVTSAVNPGSGTTTITGGTLKPGSNDALQIIQNSPKGLTIDSVIANATTTALTKSGTGTLTLTGINTYTGATFVNSGTLTISGTGSLNSGTYAGGIQIGSGGTLKINTSVNQSLTGVISGEGTLIKDGAGTLSFGAGTTGTSQNTYSNTIVNGGTFSIGNRMSGDQGVLRGTLTINTNAMATFGDTLGYQSPTTVLSVVNINGGTFERTGTVHSTTGGLTINMTGGTLAHAANTGYWQMWSSGAFGQNVINTLASANSSVISGRVEFSIYDMSFNVAEGAAAVDLEASFHLIGIKGIIKNGAGLMALSYDNSTVENTYAGYNGTTLINAGTLSLGKGTATGNLNPVSAIVNNGTLAFNRSNILTQGTDFNSVISGTGGVTQLGSGTTVLNGINTYTGTTTVSAGILNIQHASALGTTDAGTSVTSGATLQIQGISIGAESLTLSGTGAAGQNGSLVNVSGTNSYGGLVTLGSATTISSDSGVLNLTNTGTITGATRALTLTGAGNGSVSSIIGTTTGSVTKSGAGKWELAGNNSYSGGTTISAGTLVAAAVGSLGTGTTTIGGGILEQGIANALSGSSLSLNAGTFNLNGYSTAVSSLSGGSAGTVSNFSNTLAILTANASGNSTFSGVIEDGNGSGSVGLTKSGSGSLTLAGVNSYTGPTTVEGGTLVVNGSIQTDVSIDSGAFLSGSGMIGDAAYVGRLSGAGTISPGSITGAAGILSAYTFDPSAGLRAAFEFTSAGLPDFTKPANSLNDVLNLTSTAADPFAGSGGLTGLTSANAIDIYFNVTSILPADRFSGGMFVNFLAGGIADTDTLIAAVQNATYTYWVRSTGSGVRTFNSVNYDSFTSAVTLSAIEIGTTGFLTEFVVVPEPDTIALAGLGIAMAAWTIWKRRRISQLETGTGTVSTKRGV